MKTMHLTVATIAMAVSGMLAQTAAAGDCCCHCGENCGVRKVCRLKETTKKIEKICYGCYGLPVAVRAGTDRQDQVAEG